MLYVACAWRSQTEINEREETGKSHQVKSFGPSKALARRSHFIARTSRWTVRNF